MKLVVNNEYVEMCAVEIDSVCVIGVYRPPGNLSLDDFIEELYRRLNNSGVSRKRVYILGDFNVDLLVDTNKSRQLCDMMNSLFFHQLVSIPTRITHSTETLIDNIWSNNLLFKNTGVFTIDVTDHFPIFCCVIFNSEKQNVIKNFRDHSDQSLLNLANYTKTPET